MIFYRVNFNIEMEKNIYRFKMMGIGFLIFKYKSDGKNYRKFDGFDIKNLEIVLFV